MSRARRRIAELKPRLEELLSLAAEWRADASPIGVGSTTEARSSSSASTTNCTLSVTNTLDENVETNVNVTGCTHKNDQGERMVSTREQYYTLMSENMEMLITSRRKELDKRKQLFTERKERIAFVKMFDNY